MRLLRERYCEGPHYPLELQQVLYCIGVKRSKGCAYCEHPLKGAQTLRIPGAVGLVSRLPRGDLRENQPLLGFNCPKRVPSRVCSVVFGGRIRLRNCQSRGGVVDGSGMGCGRTLGEFWATCVQLFSSDFSPREVRHLDAVVTERRQVVVVFSL